MTKFKEYSGLNLSDVNKDLLKRWQELDVFHKSIETREGKPSFVFYEGPPSANGLPGIHHVMGRTIKDVFCRYKTMQGFQVKRKAGWDTHGLPVELGVEKALGITKEDIGKTISVDDYNAACRHDVLKYTKEWEDLTTKMGYWVDMNDPYITYDNRYIETLWWLLKQLYNKNLLYKGYTIQPYSPAAGTGLSTHELNQPGCYRDVKDTTCVAQFKVNVNSFSGRLTSWLNGVKIHQIQNRDGNVNYVSDIYITAWTTTPWTLPSNTALCVHPEIDYQLVRTFNPYTYDPITIIIAQKGIERNIGIHLQYNEWLQRELSDHYSQESIITDWILNGKLFNDKDYKSIVNGFMDETLANGIHYKRPLPYYPILTIKGSELVGTKYEQLIPWVSPMFGNNNAFQVISDNFVTTEDGTGIVHIAPTFGAEDAKVAKLNDVPPIYVPDKRKNPNNDRNIINPLVDEQGRFYRLEDILDEIVNKNIIDDDGNYIDRYGKVLTIVRDGKHYDEDGNILEKFEAERIIDVDLYSEWAGRYVKPEYAEYFGDNNLNDLNVDICVMLKQQGLAFKIEKHTHSYPHCWRTDKPVLYYPLDSWFIKTTACREEMMSLNDTINWKPVSTGTGRFGKWLENLQDWNLSRSRYWGTPLPIWRSEDGLEEICIGSVEELIAEIEKSIAAGFMTENPYNNFKVGEYTADNYAIKNIDLHRPYVDGIVLVSASGKPMKRELDLIDVWFDSGAMPYAQLHYPFENKEMVESGSFFPADFISEGVDQTRGWFFTLHAISTMVRGSVAFKSVISNGLVLDKNGNKMSKRLGNGVDPFSAIEKYGSDPLRWYMMTNASPWDNLKFDIEGVEEVRRKFFGTLYNTYSFFSLYANVDKFTYAEAEVPLEKRPEIDRWIISLLNTLVKDVTEYYETYEPTRAGRAISDFVGENLSNWYVRLNRKRYWGGDYDEDKIAAYQTLYTCLETVARLMAPIAPFFADQLFLDLNAVTGKDSTESVHLADFPTFDEALIDTNLEECMQLAQQTSSMILALRRKAEKKVRQPLTKAVVPAPDELTFKQLSYISELVKAEVNVKELEIIPADTDMENLVKKIKPNFKTLGKKYGKQMKEIAAAFGTITSHEISEIERKGEYTLKLASGDVEITTEDVEIITEDMPGWLVANEGKLTVALDITVTEELQREGIARELVNRIQNIRKSSGFEIIDKIAIEIESREEITEAVNEYSNYIASQTLANSVLLKDSVSDATDLDFDDYIVKVSVKKD